MWQSPIGLGEIPRSLDFVIKQTKNQRGTSPVKSSRKCWTIEDTTHSLTHMNRDKLMHRMKPSTTKTELCMSEWRHLKQWSTQLRAIRALTQRTYSLINDLHETFAAARSKAQINLNLCRQESVYKRETVSRTSSLTSHCETVCTRTYLSTWNQVEILSYWSASRHEHGWVWKNVSLPTCACTCVTTLFEHVAIVRILFQLFVFVLKSNFTVVVWRNHNLYFGTWMI